MEIQESRAGKRNMAGAFVVVKERDVPGQRGHKVLLHGTVGGTRLGLLQWRSLSSLGGEERQNSQIGQVTELSVWGNSRSASG